MIYNTIKRGSSTSSKASETRSSLLEYIDGPEFLLLTPSRGYERGQEEVHSQRGKQLGPADAS